MSTALLLAAGAARRFGRDKLLQPLPDGRCIAVAAADTLMAAGLDCVAVLRPGDAALAERLRHAGATCVANPAPERGMATSIVTGIRSFPRARYWLIALADMPWVQVDTLRALRRMLDAGAPIAAPVYRGRRGHPVGFAAMLGEELLGLRGDHGARALLQRHAGHVSYVPVDDQGIVLDVDRPGDLPSPRAAPLA